MKQLILTMLLLLVAGAAGAGERIVSQSPYITNTLMYLGLGDRIVGVSRYDDLDRPKTGGVMDPDKKAIAALHPDYLFFSDWTSKEVQQQVTPEGAESVVLHGFQNMNEVTENIRTICKTLGVEDGEAKAAAFDRRWREAAAQVDGLGRRVLILSSCKGTPFSFGVKTYLHDLFATAGFNVVDDYPTIRHLRPGAPVATVADLVRRTKPEIIFVLKDDAHSCPVVIGTGNYQVVQLNGANFTSASPRLLSGIEELQRQFGEQHGRTK